MKNIQGTKIFLITRAGQIRTNRKRRINKKWLKKYGCYPMQHNKIYVVNGALWMSRLTWQKIKSLFAKEAADEKED